VVKVRVTVAACDVCGDEAEEWHMTPPDGARTAVDLCELHAAPLRDVLTHAPKNGDDRAVKTMEQIEREKKAAQRAASRIAKEQKQRG
jgi:hypothetical protein